MEELNGSTKARQEARPVESKDHSVQPMTDFESHSNGEQTISTGSNATSRTANGIISDVQSGSLEEQAESQAEPQDTSSPMNGHVAPGETSAAAALSSQPNQKSSNPTVDGSASPVYTPFLFPHSSAHLPARPALTTDQEAKYTTVLTAARSWTAIPSSTKSHEATPLTPSERLWLTRECLLRYLRAAKWVIPTATTRLQATLIWRRQYGLASHTADYISEENETGKQVILGFDMAGRPCLYLNPHKQNTKESKRQMHHLVFMLERCIDLMAPGVETLALLVNFKDSRRGQSASVSQGRETISILQNHYPERLGRALVQDVPWLIWGFFKAIGPFIDPLTREKLKFDENLRLLVPPEQLIKQYKGDVEFEYVHEKYWTALNELAEARRRDMWDRWETAGSLIGESESYLKGTGKSVGAGMDTETNLEKAMAGAKIDE